MIRQLLTLAVAVGARLSSSLCNQRLFKSLAAPLLPPRRRRSSLKKTILATGRIVAMGRDRFLDEENLRRTNIRNRRRL